MKRWSILLFSVLLAACAGTAQMQRPVGLFNDQLFRKPSERISSADVFAVSPEMKRYLSNEIAGQLRAKGPQQGLVDALNSMSQLKLEYDSAVTRNAAQAFAARAGNCLSLVIMTAAFAKEIGVPVRYQSVYVDETWSRSGNLYFSNGHVNLSLGKRLSDARLLYDESYLLTIDFVRPEDTRGLRTRDIDEETILAMYMNNRAAESLARGRLDDAYWWAREAIVRDPGFLSSLNTLGVIYRRHGDMQAAERALRHVLEREPGNVDSMSNLALVLNDQGRIDESTALTRQLAQIQPHPPFHYFNLGQAAMRRGDFQMARDMFAKEIGRAAYYHEFHFWLALAHFGLGEFQQARDQLALAMENSTTRKDQELYAAKLDRIKAYHFQ